MDTKETLNANGTGRERILSEEEACLVDFHLAAVCCVGTEEELRTALGRRLREGRSAGDFAVRQPVDAFSAVMAEAGYTPKTTFWMDFSIADRFGTEAVENTYRRAVEEWRSDAVYLTELTMVLNHKIWQHHKKDAALAVTYDRLWRSLDGWCRDNLHGEDLDYFYRTTD